MKRKNREVLRCALNEYRYANRVFLSDYITLNVPPRAFSNVPLQIWSL